MYTYRNYAYLNTDTLNNIAQDLDIPQVLTREIVEKTSSNIAGEAGLGTALIATAHGSTTKASEYQETYSLTKDVKSAATKLITQLIEGNHAHIFGELDEVPAKSSLTRGNLLQITGKATITAASAFGIIFQHFSPLVINTASINNFKLNDYEAEKMAKRVLLTTEMPPISLLYKLEMQGYLHSQGISVYLDFEPGHFVQTQETLNLDDEVTVFGHISRIVRPGNEGYMDLSMWAFPSLNSSIIKTALAKDDTILDAAQKELGKLYPQVANREEPLYIKGPAVILKVIAMY